MPHGRAGHLLGLCFKGSELHALVRTFKWVLGLHGVILMWRENTFNAALK